MGALPFLPKLVRLKAMIYRPLAKLGAEFFASGEPVLYSEIGEYKFDPIETGGKWGGLFQCAWFRFKGEIPKDCVGKRVAAVIDIDGEGCVFGDGVPLQGLTHRSAGIDILQPFIAKKTVEITESSAGGEKIEILVDASDNGWDGKSTGRARLKRADLCVEDAFAKEFYYDFATVFVLYASMKKCARKAELKKILDSAYKTAVSGNAKDIADAKTILSAELNKDSDLTRFKMYAIGHAHLDLVWLWPLRETKRKAARTYSSALKNLEKYDGYVFGSSQPQQYEFIKQNHPELFEKIRAAVKSGKIETQGGMWTEPDVNLTSGESLVRQAYYGKKFFKDEFGRDTRVLWLPDVFGFSAQLPQIAKKTGMDYFMTIKLSWNEHNEFPYNSFVWEALDGTGVLAHIPPEGTYNSDASPEAVNIAFEKYKDKDKAPVMLLPYGIGDGGGGPNEIHLEFVKRLKREGGVKGLPPVIEGNSEEFFGELSRYRSALNTHRGEMYLEKHQGTYTTQAKNKKYNRQAETAFHNIEFLAAAAEEYGFDCKALSARLDPLWKEVLLYQFHDALPGSSINRVYKETTERYKIIFKELNLIRDELINFLSEKTSGALLDGISGGGAENKLPPDGGVTDGKTENITAAKNVITNGITDDGTGKAAEIKDGIPNGETNGGITDKKPENITAAKNAIPNEKTADAAETNASAEDGALYAVNASPFIRDEYIKYGGEWYKAEIMPYASAKLKPVKRVPDIALKVERNGIENEKFKIKFADAGYISSIKDKVSGTEYIKGTANRLVVYTDRPKQYDAWDINIKYPEQEKSYFDAVNARSYIDGASAVRETEYKNGRSRIIQRVVLKYEAEHILFETEVDWKARRKMLRADFYPSFFSDKATFDVQFGNVERSTGTKTKKDYAQFEVCAHKWADVSDEKRGFGMSILNDCKYGHRIKDGLISLNLLRSPKFPDKRADIGKHFFTYAIYPHTGGVFDGRTVPIGYELNNPPIITEKPLSIGTTVLINRPNVIADTVKPSFDGEKKVLRVFENSGIKTAAGIKTGFPYKKAYETDMLESEVYRELDLDSVEFSPYEIKTIVIEK
jgi:alpha-mannosidase